MIRRILFALLLVAALWAGAMVWGMCSMGGPMHHGMMGAGRGSVSMARHHYVMRHGLGPEYAGKRNPLPATDENVRAGAELYARHCAVCHGPRGRGDGEGGRGLVPPPADLRAAVRMPMATDAYLYWTISEGGVPIGSPMPPFRGVLTDEQIWQIILHLRRL